MRWLLLASVVGLFSSEVAVLYANQVLREQIDLVYHRGCTAGSEKACDSFRQLDVPVDHIYVKSCLEISSDFCAEPATAE